MRPDHYIRSERYDKLFDGLRETGGAPTAKTPAQLHAALHEYVAFLARRRDRRSSTVECRVQTNNSEEGRPGDTDVRNVHNRRSSIGGSSTPSTSNPGQRQPKPPVTSTKRKR